MADSARHTIVGSHDEFSRRLHEHIEQVVARRHPLGDEAQREVEVTVPFRVLVKSASNDAPGIKPASSVCCVCWRTEDSPIWICNGDCCRDLSDY